jgi:hypothetical protein
MPLTTQILCDGCQTAKKDSNHWYALTVRRQGIEVTPLMLRPDGRPHAERDGLQQYFCGRYCLHNALTKWMDDLLVQAASLRPTFRSQDGGLFLQNQALPSRDEGST